MANQRHHLATFGPRWAMCCGALLVGVAWVPSAVAQVQPAAFLQNANTPRVYAVEPAKLNAIADELRKRFAALPTVRIAADPRTSQIIVLAPEASHAEVARIIASPLPAAAAQAAVTPLPSTRTETVERPATITHNVKHLDQQQWQRLFARLPSLVAAAPGSAGGLRYAIRSTEGAVGSLELEASGRRISVTAPPTQATGWQKLLTLYDRRALPLGEEQAVVNVAAASPDRIQASLSSLRTQVGEQTVAFLNPPGNERGGNDLPGRIFEQRMLAQAPQPELPAPQPKPVDAAAPNDPAAQPVPGNEPAGPADGALIGPVQIEYLEGLDVIVVRGNKRDVERVTRIISDIEKLSAVTQPEIRVHLLKHVDSQALNDLVKQFYDSAVAPRFGKVSYTPLVKPNALLLIGRADGVQGLVELIEKLDQPVEPQTQFQVFQLKYLPAADAEAALKTFFENRGGLGPRVRVLADFRTNALMVAASPRDLAEIRALLSRLDVVESKSTQEVRVFRLKNSLATELAPILQDAISGQAGARPAGAQPATTPGGGGAAAAQRTSNQVRSTMLQLAVVDPEKGRLLKSGILADVKVTADSRSNTLVVTGPPESMELLGALVEELDALPSAGAVLKVFTIVNGDANALATMLQTLFGITQQATGGFGGAAANQLPQQTATGQGESSLVALRFGVDQRTNSIIASGSPGDLNVVEAILLRLDEGDVRQRRTEVYRLRHAPAADVSNAINQFLSSERQLQQVAPGTYSPFEQIDREVVVVPEQVSNSLIVSATPRYFEEIKRIVEELDARPPMVLIQVLIGEVDLDNFEEIGVELGIQDSLLFNRSELTNVITPGFNFNNQALGNANNAASLASKNNVAGQGLSHFALGRTNGQLGYGGMVLSASSDAVSVLIRALEERRCMQVLARPQVMTLDNQPAFVQVGARVPRITSTQTTATGTINNTVLENVGLILGVTPRISPDGTVVMEIDAERSELGPESEGIPISINTAGDVIRSPQIKTTTAQTTVSAYNGQTIVLGGLINHDRSKIERGVPWLSDIPVIGNAFRYDTFVERRKELLIIMTPHIVYCEADAEHLKRVESSRISWCLADVVDVHGDVGLNSRNEPWGDFETTTVYPDDDPTLQHLPAEAAGSEFQGQNSPGPALQPASPGNPPPQPPGYRMPPPPVQIAPPEGAAMQLPGVAPAGYWSPANPSPPSAGVR